jgi:hypothetical protein
MEVAVIRLIAFVEWRFAILFLDASADRPETPMFGV